MYTFKIKILMFNLIILDYFHKQFNLIEFKYYQVLNASPMLFSPML